MDKNSKIYIAGHKGLVGSAIYNKLQERGFSNIIGRTHHELDLIDQKSVASFFLEERPDYVFLAAAKVGGILANNTYRAQFLYENLQIQNNIIHQAYLNGVKKLMFLGSSCIYPKEAPQPLKEDYLLLSPLEYTNEPYAVAKISGIKMCESYNIQYGTNFIAVMPTNLYGPNDNYDLAKSHVLPALIRKMHLGKCLINNDWQSLRNDLNKNPIEGIDGHAADTDIINKLNFFGIKQDSNQEVNIILWGSGKPLREFLHSYDMADACVYIMENIDFSDLVENDKIRNTHINIGTGIDIPISELALFVKRIVGFEGGIQWDLTKPDGTYRKMLDVSKLNSLGWKYKIGLEEGIDAVYRDYLA